MSSSGLLATYTPAAEWAKLEEWISSKRNYEKTHGLRAMLTRNETLAMQIMKQCIEPKGDHYTPEDPAGLLYEKIYDERTVPDDEGIKQGKPGERKELGEQMNGQTLIEPFVPGNYVGRLNG